MRAQGLSDAEMQTRGIERRSVVEAMMETQSAAGGGGGGACTANASNMDRGASEPRQGRHVRFRIGNTSRYWTLSTSAALPPMASPIGHNVPKLPRFKTCTKVQNVRIRPPKEGWATKIHNGGSRSIRPAAWARRAVVAWYQFCTLAKRTPLSASSHQSFNSQQHAAKGDDSTRSDSVSHTSLTAPCSCLATCLDAMTSTARCCPPATAVVDCTRRQRYPLAMLGP